MPKITQTQIRVHTETVKGPRREERILKLIAKIIVLLNIFFHCSPFLNPKLGSLLQHWEELWEELWKHPSLCSHFLQTFLERILCQWDSLAVNRQLSNEFLSKIPLGKRFLKTPRATEHFSLKSYKLLRCRRLKQVLGDFRLKTFK